VLHEIESLDAPDQYFPGPGEQSEEFTRFLEQHPETVSVAMRKAPLVAKSESPVLAR
jgi:hypothetical protein